MKITGATLATLGVSFSTIFNNVFKDIVNQKDKIATTVPSTTATNEYGWLGAMPGMREWLGDKHIKEVSAHSYTINNKEWENTIAVRRSDLEDDNLGIYNPMISELAYTAAVHPDKLVFGLLKQGISTKCYDGQYFFDTDHPVNGQSVSNYDNSGSKPFWCILDTSRPLKPIIFQNRKPSNLVAQTDPQADGVFNRGEFKYSVEARYNVGFGLWQMAYGSSVDLTEDSFNAGRAAMRKFTNDAGEPLGVKPTVIVVSPDLEATAEKLFAVRTHANGGDNPLYKKVEIIVADRW